MMVRNALIGGLVLAVSLGATTPAQASCNSVPAASELSAQAHVPVEIHPSGGNPQPVPNGAFRYKAAFGRTDGINFVPSAGNQMRFAADGFCVGDPKNAAVEGVPAIMPIGPVDDLAIFVAYDAAPGFPIPVWPYVKVKSPQTPLPALLDTMMGLRPLHGPAHRPSVHFAIKDWDTRVDSISIGQGVNGVGIATPSLVDEAVASSVGSPAWHLESSSVRVLAVRIGEKNVRQLAAELDSFLDNKCATLCARKPPKDLVLCVDSIYSRSIGDAVNALLAYEEDKLICSVNVPSDPRLYPDFADACEDTITAIPAQPPGSKPSIPAKTMVISDTVLSDCAARDTDLKIYRGECGAIHIPLNYKNIRTRRAFSDGREVGFANRRLSGRSGVGRELDADLKRIYIPGREFVGSLPHHDGGSELPDTNFRLPDVQVFYPDTQDSAEIGITGVVDKDDSTIVILPRHPVKLICEPENPNIQHGCMKAENADITCACSDVGAADCSCKDAQRGGQYFACNGGDRTNMPCTRDAHCESRDKARSGGYCNRQPICRPEGTVWRRKPKNDDPDPTGSALCWKDADCAEGEQCGYSLFEFASRIAQTPNGIYRLQRSIVPPAPTPNPLRRGACVHDTELVCSNAGVSGMPEACPDSHRCRGYLLTAGKEVP